MHAITIHPVAINTENLITAVARLLCLSRLAESERERDDYCHCAAEFSAIFGLDSKRVTDRAKAMLNDAKRTAAAQYN